MLLPRYRKVVRMPESLDTRATFSQFGLWAGVIAFITVLMVGPPASLTVESQLLSPAWVALALLVLMATWWVTEAIPIAVTALLPMIVLPLTGTLSIADAAAPYMHPIVVLLMGGFMFAKALERWRLHERIALNIVYRSSGSPSQLVGSFMLAAALLSMWISNTATCIMMVPIAMSVASAAQADNERPEHFRTALLLGIAYGCSIGGLGTPIGTPTNLIVIGYLSAESDLDISFGQWLAFGLPVVALLLPAAWWVLTRWVFALPQTANTAARGAVEDALQRLGPMQSSERRVVVVFVVIAALWIFRRPMSLIEIPLPGGPIAPFAFLTDHIIAVIAVLLVFLVRAGGGKRDALLDWASAERIPWGVVLLFGGGMSLANAINTTGLGLFFGESLAGASALPLWVLILMLTAAILMLTEVTSNVATASALMPVMGALALSASLPVEVLAAPIALAASCAFMFPMATGPNAVVFASGGFSMLTMARVGLRLNMIAVLVITLAAIFLAPQVLGSPGG
ncbi:MAG: SLC13 family permease [Pseudomonadota bacterium]